MSDVAKVNCGSCRHCCKNELVFMTEHDDQALYAGVLVSVVHPMTGKRVNALPHKPNGDCIYLGPLGCTIHGKHPYICRIYDCATAYSIVPRAERRRRMKAGVNDPEREKIGREKWLERQKETAV